MCVYMKVVCVKTREAQTFTHRDTEMPRHRDTQNFRTQRASHAKTYRAKPAAAQKVAVVRIMRPFS